MNAPIFVCGVVSVLRHKVIFHCWQTKYMVRVECTLEVMEPEAKVSATNGAKEGSGI